jgi:hypothetical protein
LFRYLDSIDLGFYAWPLAGPHSPVPQHRRHASSGPPAGVGPPARLCRW